MRILIVEDDEFKLSQLLSFVEAKCLHAAVLAKASYQSGLCAALDWSPDLILLDMNLPNYDTTPTDDGYRTLLFAGREILQELHRLKVRTSVIVVTQFEQFGEGDDVTTLTELSSSLKDQFADSFLGTVYYHPAQEDWKNSLLAIIRGIEESP